MDATTQLYLINEAASAIESVRDLRVTLADIADNNPGLARELNQNPLKRQLGELDSVIHNLKIQIEEL